MQEENYGYYDSLSEQWVALCSESEIMTCWADTFLPTVNTIFSSNKPGGYFKGTETCLACLFETGRYDEIIEIVQKKANPLFNFKKYVIKVIVARGDLEKALSMLDEYLKDSNTLYQAAHLGEQLLIEAGRSEEAYKRYTLKLPFQTTGLATLSAIRKKYPAISPQRILSDLIDAEPGNERRYFAAARKIGMIELALEIAEKFNVEPKTLTTACKDYLEKDANLALRFGMMALQSYSSGYGYEPEYSDIQKCYDLVSMAAERVDKKKEISDCVDKMVQNDRSVKKLFTLAVRCRHLATDA
jgi:hypothetical protein